MTRSGMLVVLSCLFALSCQGRFRGHDSPVTKSTDPASLGSKLKARGEYLLASYFFEAAINQGGDEKRLLPELVDCQVRSGRLLASLSSLRRLMEIQPGDGSASRLSETIAGITGRPTVNETEVNQ